MAYTVTLIVNYLIIEYLGCDGLYFKRRHLNVTFSLNSEFY